MRKSPVITAQFQAHFFMVLHHGSNKKPAFFIISGIRHAILSKKYTENGTTFGHQRRLMHLAEWCCLAPSYRTGSYLLWISSKGTLPRSPQMPLFPSRMPQGITILMPAPWGSFNSFFIRLLSKPSSGQVS